MAIEEEQGPLAEDAAMQC